MEPIHDDKLKQNRRRLVLTRPKKSTYFLFYLIFVLRSCIPNTRPPGEVLKAETFLVIGLALVNFIPASLLVILNILIGCRLLMFTRPNNGLVSDKKAVEDRDEKTKVYTVNRR